MNHTKRPPGKRKPSRAQPDADKHPGKRPLPAEAERTDEVEAPDVTERSNPSKPVTNQDEQDKITNAEETPPLGEQ